MSKKESQQSKAKREQGWRKHADACVRCKHFTMDTKMVNNGYGMWPKESNLRCTLGGFKTGRSNSCNRFEPKENQS